MSELSVCANCDCRWEIEQLVRPIPDLQLRVAPGEEMPAGECPACGALCHLVPDHAKDVRFLLYDFDADQILGNGLYRSRLEALEVVQGLDDVLILAVDVGVVLGGGSDEEPEEMDDADVDPGGLQDA